MAHTGNEIATQDHTPKEQSVFDYMSRMNKGNESTVTQEKYEGILMRATKSLEKVKEYHLDADILLIKMMESIAELYQYVPDGEEEAAKYLHDILNQCDTLDNLEDYFPMAFLCKNNKCPASFLNEYDETNDYCKALLEAKDIHKHDNNSFVEHVWNHLDLVFD